MQKYLTYYIHIKQTLKGERENDNTKVKQL